MEKKKCIYDKLLKWDCDDNPLAPLTDLQNESVQELCLLKECRVLPELSTDDIFSNIQVIRNENVKHITEKYNSLVENEQEFMSWISAIEENIAEDHNLIFKTYVEEMVKRRDQCSNLLNDVTPAFLLSLDALQTKYIFVSSKTNALHEACECLMQEESKLVNSVENVSQKLCYFSELEVLSQKLASPTLSVTDEAFVPLLVRLDECIAYLVAHEHFKETNDYLVRFQHLQNNALGLIKTYVIATLEQITKNVLPKEGNLSSRENAFTLYYAKFRSYAPRIQTLVKQIEDRAVNNTDYQFLRIECYECYFNQRHILLGPSVSNAINDLSVNHEKDHCTLIRNGCAFLLHICGDEYQLFYQFFSKPAKELDIFLESLCMRLYDVLRPVIIHINHLETLAELCGILKVEMSYENMQFGTRELKAFESVTQQMLEDVQERLVYRMHVYINTDILGYDPAPGDLAYPEKLEMMENITGNLVSRDLSQSISQLLINSVLSNTGNEIKMVPNKNQVQTNYSDDSDAESITSSNNPEHIQSMHQQKPIYFCAADLYGMYYPTVRRTLVCLSKLYRCLDKSIFQDLSQEVLGACILSLSTAGDEISKRKTVVDGQLFQIKHLLILREQITPFQIDYAIKQTALDFTNVKDAAYSLFQKKSQLLSFNSNNAVLDFLLHGVTPHVTEHLIDSKKAIDKKLKMICEQFISHTASILLGDVLQFLEKYKVLNELNANSKAKDVSLSCQPFATTENVSELVSNALRDIKNKLPSVLRSMSLYLSNPDTEYILFKIVKVQIHTSFEQLLRLIKVNCNEEEQIIIACPSIEQINIILSSNIK